MAVIWSIASIVVQYLYTDQHFDSPFLLTYIGTSLFILLLISHSVWERRHKLCFCTDEEEETDIIPWRTSYPYQQVPLASESVSLENVQIDFTEPSSSLDDDQKHGAMTTTAIDSTSIWSHEQHLRVAIKIAPVWFVANWAYNCSLAYTSITSSTVLASTGSLFTFLFAVLCGDESFTCLKLVGVLLGVTGSILTGLHDVVSNNSNETTTTTTADDPSILCVAGPSGTPHHVDVSQQDAFAGHAIWGDALGLLSAVGYGTYAVMIRIYCPRDERCMSMQLLLGYIGLFNAITLSPITFYILLKPSFDEGGGGGNHSAAAAIGLTWIVFGFLVAKGTLDNVLSDYLWARAVVLTSATVATVGLGLTIPLAFVSDWIMGHGNVLDGQSIAGAVAVLAGFIIVNVGEKGEESVEDSASSEQVTTDSSSSDIIQDGHR